MLLEYDGWTAANLNEKSGGAMEAIRNTLNSDSNIIINELDNVVGASPRRTAKLKWCQRVSILAEHQQVLRFKEKTRLKRARH
jgi:hypothetical protein